MVALPAEGVDRNVLGLNTASQAASSPSPRRAWIEILMQEVQSYKPSVALPAEGVDRNMYL